MAQKTLNSAPELLKRKNEMKTSAKTPMKNVRGIVDMSRKSPQKNQKKSPESKSRIYTPQKARRTLNPAPKLLKSENLSEKCIVANDVNKCGSNVKCKAQCMTRTTSVESSSNCVVNSNNALRAFDSDRSNCNDVEMKSFSSGASQRSEELSVNVENELNVENRSTVNLGAKKIIKDNSFYRFKGLSDWVIKSDRVGTKMDKMDQSATKNETETATKVTKKRGKYLKRAQREKNQRSC